MMFRIEQTSREHSIECFVRRVALEELIESGSILAHKEEIALLMVYEQSVSECIMVCAEQL